MVTDLTRKKRFLQSASGKIHTLTCSHAGKASRRVELTPTELNDLHWRSTCSFCVFSYPSIVLVVWDE